MLLGNPPHVPIAAIAKEQRPAIAKEEEVKGGGGGRMAPKKKYNTRQNAAEELAVIAKEEKEIKGAGGGRMVPKKYNTRQNAAEERAAIATVLGGIAISWRRFEKRLLQAPFRRILQTPSSLQSLVLCRAQENGPERAYPQALLHFMHPTRLYHFWTGWNIDLQQRGNSVEQQIQVFAFGRLQVEVFF
jgi:hypothetical protein